MAAAPGPGTTVCLKECATSICRPDSRERSVDEYGFMKDAMRAGYRAVMGVMFTSDRVQMTDEDIVNVYKESYK